jgi:hypothetical protein
LLLAGPRRQRRFVQARLDLGVGRRNRESEDEEDGGELEEAIHTE